MNKAVINITLVVYREPHNPIIQDQITPQMSENSYYSGVVLIFCEGKCFSAILLSFFIAN